MRERDRTMEQKFKWGWRRKMMKAPSHEKVRLTFGWLELIVMVVLKGAPR